MKNKLIAGLMLVGVLVGFTGVHVGATDVWVARWDSENTDIYVMDDTLSYRSDARWKTFSVSTKIVKNGKLQEVMTWHFSKLHSDAWRYYTNTMQRGHTTIVSRPNKVFEYSMDHIQWPYEVRNQYYYY